MPSKSSPFDLRLRPIRVDDVDAIMEWINDPEVTRNFAGIRGRITREQEVDFLEQMIASENDRLYAIEALDGTYLGNAGLHKIYWPARNARLGIVIGSPKARGQGRGQQVLKLAPGQGLYRPRLAQSLADPFRDQSPNGPYYSKARV